MYLSIRLKTSAFRTFLLGRRHQGRHRAGPTSKGEAGSGWSGLDAAERQPASVGHPVTAVQDFYVVSPNVPALPVSLGSSACAPIA
jgi:hypothetical protein